MVLFSDTSIRFIKSLATRIDLFNAFLGITRNGVLLFLGQNVVTLVADYQWERNNPLFDGVAYVLFIDGDFPIRNI